MAYVGEKSIQNSSARTLPMMFVPLLRLFRNIIFNVEFQIASVD